MNLRHLHRARARLERAKVTVQSVHESRPLVFAWCAALVALAVSPRWARGVVAAGVLAQLAYGLHEAARIYPPEVFADVSVHRLTMAWLRRSGVALCLPLVPLVAWHAHELRVTVALLAMGRGRDAWTRSGGALSLIAAVPVMAINRATLDGHRSRGARRRDPTARAPARW